MRIIIKLIIQIAYMNQVNINICDTRLIFFFQYTIAIVNYICSQIKMVSMQMTRGARLYAYIWLEF